MGTVKAYRKTHWVVALDTDLASIPNPQLGDTALTEDKKKLYYWEGGAWKTGLGYEYVPRAVVAADFGLGDFTLDGAWHVDDLDLSAIVPADAVAVHLNIVARGNAASLTLNLRANATTKVSNTLYVTTQVANVTTFEAHGIVYVDSDRLLDTYASVGLNIAGVTVLGWFI